MSAHVYRNFADIIDTMFVKNLTTEDSLVILGDLNVDSNTLYVDSSNNRVGVNKPIPAYPLDIVGDVNTTTAYNIGGTQVLTSSALGSGITGSSLTSLGTMTSDLNMGTKNITNIGNLAGTLTTAAQPNITSLGSLTGLFVNTANIQRIDTQNPVPGSNSINITGNQVSASASHRWLKFLCQSSPICHAGIQFTSFSQPNYAIVNDGAFRIGYNTVSLGASTGAREVAQDWSTFTEALNISSAGSTTISTLAVTNTITNKQTPKAFICFDGTGPTTKTSFNIASVTRNSTCIFTIAFTNAMADANYAWVASAGFGLVAQANFVSSPNNVSISTWKTTSALQLQSYYANQSSNTNPSDMSIIIFN